MRATLDDGIRTNDLLGADGGARAERRSAPQAFADAVAERVGAVEVAA